MIPPVVAYVPPDVSVPALIKRLEIDPNIWQQRFVPCLKRDSGGRS